MCMHAFLYLCLNEQKCVNVHQVTCVFLFFSFTLSCCAETQLIGLYMQICDHSQKEVLAQDLPLTF